MIKQLTKEYHDKLNTKFLEYYEKTFTNNRMFYCHWPVGGCDQDFTEYHQDVLFQNDKAVLVNNTDIGTDLYAATWHRNTNSTAIALGGFLNATTTDLGSNVAHPEQLKLLALTLANDCLKLKVPFGQIWSHAEIADLDGYGPHCSDFERWDLYCWINTTTLKLLPAFEKCPEGWVYLMDWVRGEVALQLQTLTQKEWE
jgi:hypothetical protein